MLHISNDSKSLIVYRYNTQISNVNHYYVSYFAFGSIRHISNTNYEVRDFNDNVKEITLPELAHIRTHNKFILGVNLNGIHIIKFKSIDEFTYKIVPFHEEDSKYDNYIHLSRYFGFQWYRYSIVYNLDDLDDIDLVWVSSDHAIYKNNIIPLVNASNGIIAAIYGKDLDFNILHYYEGKLTWKSVSHNVIWELEEYDLHNGIEPKLHITKSGLILSYYYTRKNNEQNVTYLQLINLNTNINEEYIILNMRVEYITIIIVEDEGFAISNEMVDYSDKDASYSRSYYYQSRIECYNMRGKGMLHSMNHIKYNKERLDILNNLALFPKGINNIINEYL